MITLKPLEHIHYAFGQDNPILLPVLLCCGTFICLLLGYIPNVGDIMKGLATLTTIGAGITTMAVGIMNMRKMAKEAKKEK